MNVASPRKIDIEVLPPEPAASDALRAAFQSGGWPRVIAWLMDNLIAIPGLKRRLGLNPLLDLVPVFGDGAAAVVSLIPLLAAARAGIPRVVLARMSANIVVNSAFGVIPGVGEVFAFWFRPNQRNYDLLRRHLPAPGAPIPASTARHWLFFVALFGGLLLFLAVAIAAGALLTYWILHEVIGRR